MTYFDIAGRRFGYFASGQGPVAILVHGFPLDARMWLDQVHGLADVRTVVAVDLRGSGRSSPVDGSALTMERHADDLAEIVAAIGVDVVDLVGLSMGGYVALAFAERHPALLRSLALVDTKATADDDGARAGRDAMAERVVAEGRSGIATDLGAGLLAPNAALTAKARLRTMVEGTPVESIVGALAGMKSRPDRSGLLPKIEVPCAVIVGAEDRLTTPEDAHVMASSIPDASLHVVAGAGHLSPLEAPAEVNDALRALWERAATP